MNVTQNLNLLYFFFLSYNRIVITYNRGEYIFKVQEQTMSLDYKILDSWIIDWPQLINLITQLCQITYKIVEAWKNHKIILSATKSKFDTVICWLMRKTCHKVKTPIGWFSGHRSQKSLIKIKKLQIQGILTQT